MPLFNLNRVLREHRRFFIVPHGPRQANLHIAHGAIKLVTGLSHVRPNLRPAVPGCGNCCQRATTSDVGNEIVLSCRTEHTCSTNRGEICSSPAKVASVALVNSQPLAMLIAPAGEKCLRIKIKAKRHTPFARCRPKPVLAINLSNPVNRRQLQSRFSGIGKNCSGPEPITACGSDFSWRLPDSVPSRSHREIAQCRHS